MTGTAGFRNGRVRVLTDVLDGPGAGADGSVRVLGHAIRPVEDGR
ncbi:hypothetical protein ABT121_03420 [Streptomyces sp. NPDC001928]